MSSRFQRLRCVLGEIPARPRRPLRHGRTALRHFGAVSQAVSPRSDNSVRAGQVQSCHPQQIVSAGYKVAPGLCSFSAPIPAASQAAHRFDPAKDFFDPLANALAGLIAAPCGRAPIQSGEVHRRFARHMRRDRSLATPLHEVLAMIPLVGPHRFGDHAFVQLLVRVHLAQGYHRLGFGDGVVEREVGAQAVPVLHQDVAAKTQPGFFALRLAIEHALGVRRALVRVVAALFPAEVHARVARILVLRGLDLGGIGPVLAHEAFQAGPRFDERAVGGEVGVAAPAFLAAEIIDLGEEELGHVSGEDALVVLGEDAVVKAAFAELTVQEPEPEQIVAKLLAEEAFAAHGVEGGEHAGLEQLLGRDAGPAQFLVELVEEGRELLEHEVHTALDAAQRMVGGHALVEVDDGQEVRLGLRFSAHASLIPIIHPRSNSHGTISPTC